MNPTELRKLWLRMRRVYALSLLENWGDADTVDMENEKTRLAALHSIVQNSLDSFKPQA